MQVWKATSLALAIVIALAAATAVVAYAAMEHHVNKVFEHRHCHDSTPRLPVLDTSVPLCPRAAVKYCLATYARLCGHLPECVPATTTVYMLPHERGMVLRSGDRAVVCFRGTCNFVDVLVDVSARSVRAMGGRVYAGFYRAYTAVRAHVHAAVEGARVVELTGHSLGGALAVLGAVDLASTTRATTAIAVAPPKVGDEAFVAYAARRPAEIHVLVNAWDVVPCFPGLFGRYHHAGTVHMYAADAGTWAGNHALRTYASLVAQER